jgi:methyltransferase (TIGR00027 family)
MKPGTASRTAQYMALFRAIETARPPDNRLFDDPYATLFLDPRLKLVATVSSLPIVGSLTPKLVHQQAPGAISSGIARTKYIDDLVEKTVTEGVKQVILLGAGFDTRALRLECLKTTHVIEIDHPDTAKLKLDRLVFSLGRLPRNVTYHQVDLNGQSLDEIGAACNIDLNLPTTIIWEGVTNYLTPAGIDATFLFTRRFCNGIHLIFTYVDRRVLEHPEEFVGAEKLFKNLRANQEQWTFGFVPNELPEHMRRFGLTLVVDSNATDYRNRYMPERGDIAAGYEFYRVALAERS